MVLLKTILILVLVYYTIKLLAKWLVPKLFSYAIKKTQERFGQQFGNHQDFGPRPEQKGETKIFKKPFKKSNPSKKVGEYIDFEEID
ncbi:hypothetical protein HME9304_02991 [Flagellimonas maritima]|uniref:DUF4834 family protein n=1 Tax=Flagellimonas maritima TaxID=1383885 RepID=A0A2Z4LW55_9FLAO|nr:DUF4834 family protein [Allomuricauda aurantiaca]AWX45959.1 hypothetical protein HME9304_02991 [Allomuricauda aurantiaca]